MATRIYLPEPAAASFRLGAVADALAGDGARVVVLTSSEPRGEGTQRDFVPGSITVKRFPVLRDKTGYVRGYVPYMSFDIPLFFRLLLSPRFDVLLVEPPPTTGFAARLACGLRRIPYVWYAADVWSDATEIAGAPSPVVGVVRALEKYAVRGASGIIAVSDGVKARVQELGGRNVRVVPNGIDTHTYSPDVRPLSPEELNELGIVGRYVVYAGTASEWQGALIFAQAMGLVAKTDPGLQLVYVGQGTEWEDIGAEARRLKHEFGREVIVQLPPADPAMVARILKGAEAALVSIVPGQGYDFAYPTKVLAALSSGRRVLFAGVGPAAQDLMGRRLGDVGEYEIFAVAEMLRTLPPHDLGDEARRRAWVESTKSLKRAGQAAAGFVLEVARCGKQKRK